MKKIIFYCTLFIGGIIGFVGWMLVCATKVRTEATWSTLQYMSSLDNLAAILFIGCFIAGFALAVKEISSDHNKAT